MFGNDDEDGDPPITETDKIKQEKVKQQKLLQSLKTPEEIAKYKKETAEKQIKKNEKKGYQSRKKQKKVVNNTLIDPLNNQICQPQENFNSIQGNTSGQQMISSPFNQNQQLNNLPKIGNNQFNDTLKTIDPQNFLNSQGYSINYPINLNEQVKMGIQEIQLQKTNSKKEFSIQNEIREDQNFQQFYQKFYTLRNNSIQEGTFQQVNTYTQEDDYGNIEYKLKLVNPTYDRVEHLTTQMKFRLQEGNGQAQYKIGVEDNGNALGLNEEEMRESLGTLFYMARNLNASLIINKVKRGIEGDIAELSLKKIEIEGIKVDIKVMMLGGEGSGKSTLVGVLISGKNDNGTGSARTNVFRHKHEILDGRTSSISHQILGFDASGEIITNQNQFGPLSWAQIVETSTKILTFIDVAGNEKYAKTMIKGICSHYPDYALILIDSKAGLTNTCIDHFKLAFAFNVPVIIVLTKIDMVSEDDLFLIKLKVNDLLKGATSASKIPLSIVNEEDVALCSRMIQEDICPVFSVSCTTGEGLDFFRYFLNLLPINPSNQWNKNQKDLAEFQIIETFIKEKDIILHGMVMRGSISVLQQLLLGPGQDGNFRKVEILEIRCKRIPVRQVISGQMCSFSIKLGKFAEKWLQNETKIRRGMVLLDPKLHPKATWTFCAEIWSFNESSKSIHNNYQPVINTGHIRQSARIFLDNQYFHLRQSEDSTQRCTSIDEYHKSNPTSEDEEKKQIMRSSNNETQDQKSMINSNKDIQIQQASPLQQNEMSQQICNSQESPKLSSKMKKIAEGKQNQQISLEEDKTDNKKLKQQKSQPNLHQEPSEIVISESTKTKVVFQFLHNPEYLTQNSYLFIDENNIKAFGIITAVFYDINEKFICPGINKEQKVKKPKKDKAGKIQKKAFENEGQEDKMLQKKNKMVMTSNDEESNRDTPIGEQRVTRVDPNLDTSQSQNVLSKSNEIIQQQTQQQSQKE